VVKRQLVSDIVGVVKISTSNWGLRYGFWPKLILLYGVAYSVKVVQIPAHRSVKLMDHYVTIIASNVPRIRAYSKWIVVDGYFIKKSLIDQVLSKNAEVINRVQLDASLQ
jgi:aromatic ring-opening dioxygenase catalytic subunit (LigB family)